MIARPSEFYAALAKWTHDPRFNLGYLVSKAYGLNGRGPSSNGKRGRLLGSRIRNPTNRVFPRRQVLARIIKMENWETRTRRTNIERNVQSIFD